MSVARGRVFQSRRLAKVEWRWFDFPLIAWAVLCALASVLFALDSDVRHSPELVGIGGALGVGLLAVVNVVYVGMAIWYGLPWADVSADSTDSAEPYRVMVTPPSPRPLVSLAEMRAMLMPYALVYLLILGVFILLAVCLGVPWGAV